MISGTFSVAVIGLGRRIANVALHLQRAAPAFRVVAYADPAPAGLARMQRAGIHPEAHEDAAAMLRAVRPDAVLIGSPNHLHLEHIQLALDATDVRVFCEKPVVRTEAESFALAELLVRQPPDRLIVGLVLRALPVVKEALALVRAGGVGTVTSLEAHEHLHPEHGGFLRRDWRRYRRFAGSYLLDKCCHDLDLLNAAAGARPRRIASFAATRIFTRAHAGLDDGLRYRQWPTGWQGDERIFDADSDTADLQTLMLEYENGVLGTFHSNSHLNPPRRGWLVAGTEAALDVDLRAARLVLHPARDGMPGENRSFDSGSARDHHGADPAMAQDLAAAWLDARPFPVSAKEALVAGLTVMAADRAAATGAVVDLREIWRRLDALWP
jgi:predicted dehydrogenase